MKIGGLVKLLSLHGASFRVGLIVGFIEKRHWRADFLGNKTDWKKIDPEPHAVVLVNGGKGAIPVIDLQSVDEG